MSDSFMWVIVFCVGVAAGNCGGDQLTFKDCAIKGEAKLAGGGAIRCSIEAAHVIKEKGA